MPQIVESSVGVKSGTLEEPGERAVAQIGGVDGATNLVGEDETAGPVEGTLTIHLLYLPLQVVLE